MADPVRTEYAPETEEDEGSIVGRSIGFLGDVLKGIPGVYPAYKAIAWSGEAFGGAGSATLRVGRDILREEGVGTFLKETAIEALPFTGSTEYTGRYRKILSIDEEDGLKDRMNKARDWQHERDSAFWGEKFLSEVLFDPLTYLPIGAAIKGVKALTPAARAARLKARQLQPTVGERFVGPPVELSPQQAANWLSIRGASVPESLVRTYKFADIPSVRASTEADFPENMLGRLTRWTMRKKGVPLLHQAISLANPVVFIRAAVGLDKGGKAGARHLRFQHLLDGIRTTDMSALRQHGKTSKIFPGMYEAADGNLYVKIAKAIPTPPPGMTVDRRTKAYKDWLSKAREDAAQTDDVLIEKVFENPTRYGLDKLQKEYVETANKIVDAYKEAAKAAGVPLHELTFEAGAHYFPRFVQAIRGMEKTTGGGGAGIGGRVSALEQRLYEDIEEAVKNGVVYFGARADDPVADIVETYARSLGRAIANKRLDDEIKAMGKTLNQRILGRYGTSGMFQAVEVAEKQTTQFDNAFGMLSRVIDPQFDVRLPAARLSTSEIRSLKHIGGLAKDSQGRTIAERLDAARRMKTPRNQRRALNEIREIFRWNLQAQAVDLLNAKEALKAVAAQVKRPLNLAAMPENIAKGRYGDMLFDPEDVKQIMPFLTTVEQTMGKLTPGLRLMSTISGISRTAMLTFDFGAGLLQGAMVLTKSPKTWVNANLRSFHSLFDPTVRYRYMQKNLDVLATYKNLHIGSTEMTEVINPGGALARAFGHVPGFRLPTKAAQRFATTYETFFDVARIEMAQAFLPAVRAGRVTADQVASHLNKLTGVLNSRALGVSATQREIEAAAFTLAPRWFRATVALFADGFQGAGKGSAGWEGTQARINIGKFFAGTTMAYVGIAHALGQPVRLDPRSKSQGGDGGQFMTVEIGGVNVGLGGKPFSMVRTLVKMALDPDNQGYYAERFIRGQSAPMTSAMWDIMSGETFIGEPVRSPGEILHDGIAPRFMPFWVESFINDDPRPGLTALPAEWVGMRTIPTLPRYRLEDIQDELAAYVTDLTPDQERRMEEKGMDVPAWEILSTTQRHSIQRDAVREEGVPKENRNIPDGKLDEFKTYDERVRKWREGKADPNGVRAFMNELEDAREDLRIAGNQRQQEYDDGVGGPRKFLDDMRLHQRDFGKAMTLINEADGQNAEAIAYFKKKNADKEYIPLQDFVYTLYIEELVQNPDLMDQYGNFNFKERDRREQALRVKYGHELVDNVERDLRAKKDMPPLWIRWLRDREILKPYWELRDRYLRSNPSVRSLMRRIERAKNRRDIREEKRLKQHPDYRRMEREIRAEKDALRERDPRLDGALVFWEYASQVRTEEAYRYLR